MSELVVHTEFILKHMEGKVEFIDLTEEVQSIVSKSKIKNGLVTVLAAHTTCAIMLQEKDKFLFSDLLDVLQNVAPKALRMGQYRHPDPHHADDFLNAHSHLRAGLMCQSQTLPIIDGKLYLGTHQKIILAELEDSHERKLKICVHVVGE